jgi:broad specificity phosphatase PhoE
MPHRLIRGLALLAAVAAARAPVPLAAQAGVVILARHGEKAAEPAGNPALSAAGEARAAALDSALAGARVDAVFVTEFTRTMRTGASVASRRHLRAQVIPVRGDSLAHARAVVAALRARPRGDAVLVVEHSNTIPAIIAALGGPALPELCRNEYATLFVLVLERGRPPRLIRSTFGTPDPADAGCGPASMMR